ncbi:RluA family pseudouridine synthase [Candidatus Gracilibacteria bacterium]|nr:RluA family pseudouridine synthase [Candidatus Gracilibacteria bacterium]
MKINTNVQSLIISHSSDIDQRLDRFVKKYLPNAPLGGIYKMLRTGKIKVNGKKKPETYMIELGDEIAFWLTDDELQSLTQEKMAQREDGIKRENLSNEHKIILEVLYEDDFLMVINKPSGMNVHPGDHKTQERSLIECVQDMLGTQYNSLTFKPALVHRIDRDTSGCLLIAKEKSTLESLLVSLQSHSIEKIYHTVIRGKPREIKGTFRERLLRVENARDEAKVRVDEAGQTAVTHYEVIKSFVPLGKHESTRDNVLSLLECRIETGRTHQIRVHLSYHNCPIIGDQAYGDRSINSYIRRQYEVNRQLLHAYSLSFKHPKTGKRLQVIAPYPSDFKRIISDSSEVQS